MLCVAFGAMLAVPGVGGAVAEPFGQVEFAGPTLTLYEDVGGKPGKAHSRIDVGSVDRSASEFLSYDSRTRMFEVELSGGRKGWLKKTSFKPLPRSNAVCERKTRMAQAPVGRAAERRVAAGQALAEELCV
jgi:hypothetical protein